MVTLSDVRTASVMHGLLRLNRFKIYGIAITRVPINEI